MKTSNKLLLSALIVFVISLGIYNTALKAEYLTGNYRDPFKNFNTLNFKDFDEIQVNSASQVDLTITKGANNVKVSKWAHNQVKISQQGKKLIIDVVYEKDKENYWGNEVLISCPKLVSVTEAGVYLHDDKKVIQNNQKEIIYQTTHETTIKGFTLDSLTLKQDNISTIILKQNEIGTLTAITGATIGSQPKLEIGASNKIAKADLKINEKGELVLNNIYIPQFTHQFGDSSKVSFSGAALKSLRN